MCYDGNLTLFSRLYISLPYHSLNGAGIYGTLLEISNSGFIYDIQTHIEWNSTLLISTHP